MGPLLHLIRFRSVLFVCVFTCLSLTRSAQASGPSESLADVATLVQMESKADMADARERCFLYTELLHNWTEVAGHALAAGDDSAAQTAMEHADANAAKLKAAIARDSKRLKNAEQLLEHSAHRLSDIVRAASVDQHDAMQVVLRHVNSVHDEMLAAVFAH